MNIARAVIGANFGDEGKGLITDYLAHTHRSDLVVRFNGGAQAGHTVVTPDGRRHVFSHFGSGSFAGAATLLSRFFLINPMLFNRERVELETKQPVNLTVMVDRNAPVTTPYDMLLNQLAEMKRGGGRHGSCGLGIGETIERHEKYLKLTVGDLEDPVGLQLKLWQIRDIWVSSRAEQLGLDSDLLNSIESMAHGKTAAALLASDPLMRAYLADVEKMLRHVTIVDDVDVIRNSYRPVFEGAQGLLLDQDHKFFPHVTRSSTGLKNVLTLLSESGRGEVETYYLTRSYLTRHGRGPMPTEIDDRPFTKVVDATNIPNDWQETLRFGWLDVELLRESIFADLKSNVTTVKVRPRLVITCLDQVDVEIMPVIDGTSRHLAKTAEHDHGDLIAKMLNRFGSHLKSFGPTRETVVDYIEDVDRQIEQEIIEERRAATKAKSLSKKKKSTMRELADQKVQELTEQWQHSAKLSGRKLLKTA